MTAAETNSLTPPPVSPVPAGTARPRWSVMIPTYHCTTYLRQTLASVLAQDPGPELMQIEVVDDCSTADDPEPVVREMGGGRVAFHRNGQNAGSAANFNTCLERSRGHLIHILHGDDWVLPGFYEKVGLAAEHHPEASLLATRCFFADEEGYYTHVTQRLPAAEQAPTRDIRDFYFGNPIQFAGIAVRRTFFESHGGFLPALHHTADWEMWTRAIAQGGGLVLPDVLGVYRVFAANETGRMARTAENLRHRARLNELLAARHADFPSPAAEGHLLEFAVAQEARFSTAGDHTAAQASRNFWTARAPLTFKLRQAVRSLRRRQAC